VLADKISSYAIYLIANRVKKRKPTLPMISAKVNGWLVQVLGQKAKTSNA